MVVHWDSGWHQSMEECKKTYDTPTMSSISHDRLSLLHAASAVLLAAQGEVKFIRWLQTLFLWNTAREAASVWNQGRKAAETILHTYQHLIAMPLTSTTSCTDVSLQPLNCVAALENIELQQSTQGTQN